VRGEAYLTAQQSLEAVAEFQKIIDHHGIVAGDPVGAFARLQVARAYARSGDKAKSKSAHEDLLAAWKEADREIPILKQAKREYAQLQ
jgi:eukaryotic-like serine/threonine-protein kinase